MATSPPRNPSPRVARPKAGKTLPAKGTALVLIDVINDLAFEGSDGLIAAAEPMAVRLAALKARAVASGVPVIYVNDNFGQWRSDFRRTVAHCTSRSSPGRVVSRRLRPRSEDYFVLKPKHSGFFRTTLDVLLAEWGTRRLVLTGMAGDICVLFTANDAYMRGLKLFVPSDCVASNSDERNASALEQMRVVLKADIRPSDRLVFGRAPRTGR